MKLFIKQCLSRASYFVKRVILSLDIRAVARKLPKLVYDKKILREHLAIWGKLHKIIDPTWYKVYSTVAGINDARFIPADTYFYVVEPMLNNRDLTRAYADKNMYDCLWGSEFFPVTLVRNIHGLLYDHSYQKLTAPLENYLSDELKIIVKPSLDTGGGKNVAAFEKRNGKFINIIDGKVFGQEYLDQKYGKNYLIQRFMEQHPYFKQFNNTSFNTMRIMTYRSVVSEDVVVLGGGGGFIRFGSFGSVKDNCSAGGQACYIHKSGKLDSYAMDVSCRKNKILPDGREFSSLPLVHKFQEAKMMVCELVKRFLYFRVLAFDIGVDNYDEIKIIEVNTEYMGIDFFQMPSGSLFGEYTDEVINYCLRKE